MGFTILALGALLTTLGAFAQQSVQPSVQQSPVQPVPVPADPPVYRISAGDLLELRYHFNPDLSSQIVVRPDGMIAVPYAGEVRASGLSAEELGKALEERQIRYLRNPQLTVVIREFAGQKVFVGGEVLGPRAIDLRGPLTCLQAVMNVGGPKNSAKLQNVLLLRYKGNGQAEVRNVDLAQVMKGTAADILLQPFDVVVVPKTRVAKAGLFMETYVNAMIPRSLFFPYNLNNTISYYVQ